MNKKNTTSDSKKDKPKETDRPPVRELDAVIATLDPFGQSTYARLRALGFCPTTSGWGKNK